MVYRTEYKSIQPYTTKDGSIIRELFHPDVHGNKQLSLAEATIPVGSETLLHKHSQSEEIYHITEGTGLMTLGEEQFDVAVGDTVCILPDIAHRIHNTGGVALNILCCCSPPYSQDDTELLK